MSRQPPLVAAVMLATLGASLSSDPMASPARPNIVFLLTDDQDVLLGSTDYMPQLQKLVATQGATFGQMYAATPVCCPSRSSIVTGLYQHSTGVTGNSIAANCSSPAFQAAHEPNTYAVHLQSAGYATFFSGKYLNDYGFPGAGGVAHVPPGWTEWRGLVGNSVYYNYTISNNGVAEQHGDDYATDYLPNVVATHAADFIRRRAKAGTPFVAVLSLPSCHEPADPAPQYAHLFNDTVAPRTPNWNTSVADSHWLQRTEMVYGLDANSASWSDLLHRRRLAVLQTVDDIVGSTISELEAAGVLDDTFIVYTSDHGYHLGQYGAGFDKRQPWDVDVRVPLYVRGPGVAAGTTFDSLVSLVDLAPTFVDMAGLPVPPRFEGVSFLPLAQGRQSAQSRTTNLIEYVGEATDGGPPSSPCSRTSDDRSLYCSVKGDFATPPYFAGRDWCACIDASNNTWSCLRTANATHDFRYCEFPQDDRVTIEYFDFATDPFELNNTAAQLPAALRQHLSQSLSLAGQCVGASACQTVLQSV